MNVEISYIGNDKSENIDHKSFSSIASLREDIDFLEERGCRSVYVEDFDGNLIYSFGEWHELD